MHCWAYVIIMANINIHRISGNCIWILLLQLLATYVNYLPFTAFGSSLTPCESTKRQLAFISLRKACTKPHNPTLCTSVFIYILHAGLQIPNVPCYLTTYIYMDHTNFRAVSMWAHRVSFSFLPKGAQNYVWIIGGASTYSCAKHVAN